MTTFESYKKFGLEMDSAMGGILMIAGTAVTFLGIVVAIVIGQMPASNICLILK